MRLFCAVLFLMLSSIAIADTTLVVRTDTDQVTLWYGCVLTSERHNYSIEPTVDWMNVACVSSEQQGESDIFDTTRSLPPFSLTVDDGATVTTLNGCREITRGIDILAQTPWSVISIDCKPL